MMDEYNTTQMEITRYKKDNTRECPNNFRSNLYLENKLTSIHEIYRYVIDSRDIEVWS
jgi:hypothetical protein